MNYPLISEYIEAIKSAEDNFEELSYLRPVLDDDGLPVMTSGNFAIVFKMKDEETGKLYALKCFTKEQTGRAVAYHQIAEELKQVNSPYIVSLRFIDKELFVDTGQTDETEFPVLLMDWVEGMTLDKYLIENLDDKYALEMLVYRFSQLAQWLIPLPFAHGDLKPDNILVREDGTLVLVDYDGMFVPAMKGHKARELGSSDFRHPLRTENDFDKHIDDFSFVSILVSLIAVSNVGFLYDSRIDEKYEDTWNNNLSLMLHTLQDNKVMNGQVEASWIYGLKSDPLFSSVYNQFLIALTSQRFDIGNNPLLALEKIIISQYKIGIKYYEIGQYQKAYTIFRLLSEDHYACGYNGLGICLANGYCGETIGEGYIFPVYHHSNEIDYQDYKLSYWCFSKASELNYLSGTCNLMVCGQCKPIDILEKGANDNDLYCQILYGICYFYGWVAKESENIINYKKENPIKAFELLIKPAYNGNRIAQSYLGRLLLKEYVEAPYLHSFQDALYWLKKAAEQEDPIAQYYLGTCYEELDKKEAVYDDDGSYYLKYFEETEKWYKRSARNGFWLAQVEVGERYWGRFSSNTNNTKNLNKAIGWLKKAAYQDYNYAYERLADLFYEYKLYAEYERSIHASESLDHSDDAMYKKELEIEFKNYSMW